MGFQNPFKPPTAPPAFAANKVLPEQRASFPSRLIFRWIVPFLDAGFIRPLEKEDLWTLPDDMLTASVSHEVENNFYSRCEPERRPRFIQDRLESASRSSPHTFTQEEIDSERGTSRADTKKSPKYDSSLFIALYKTFATRIWFAGFLKIFSDTLRTTTPLVTKVFLEWLVESYVYYRLDDEERAAGVVPKPRGIGYGIGFAVALFTMQEVAGLMSTHHSQAAQTTGLLARTGLIGVIFRKSLRISGRARLGHSVGQITTMISTDASRLDFFASSAYNLVLGPIQIVLGICLLIGNLGYSALTGLGVLLLGFPIQIMLLKIFIKQRSKGVKITDTRVRLTTEVLQGIRLIKFYAWEAFYARQIGDLRAREIRTIKIAEIARCTLVAVMTLLPVLASILSFITYALSGHNLNVAIIFSSLQLFNVIRNPLVFFPVALSLFSDALVAFGRISKFLQSEELPEPYLLDYGMKHAVKVDGDFTWEVAGKVERNKCSGKDGKKRPDAKPKSKKKSFNSKEPVLPAVTPKVEEKEKGESEGKPFELRDLKFSVPKGSFVAIVGRVGSGKSSLLQTLVGEMRKTKGEVTVSGSVAYASQVPWIRNATLRENILFGKAVNEQKVRQVIRACSLERDLEMLPHGELTEIGEKGINISGGQKARVSLARAAYSEADIVLLDDPLSAVDAYVGKAILDECLLTGPLADRTRILVTHALHVLDKTDHIYVMDNGVIVEHGTYSALMNESILFSRLIEEYGSQHGEQEAEGSKRVVVKQEAEGEAKKGGGDALMQEEERNTGAVTWEVYAQYLRFAGGIVWGPIIIILLVVVQGAAVSNNLILGFWTVQSIHGFRQGDYMAVYVALGFAQAVFLFLTTVALAWTTLVGSYNVFDIALKAVLRSPTSFFDTMPIGRILSRLSKDQDTLDNQLAQSARQFLTTSSSVIGTIALVFYTFPSLGLIFLPMGVLYYFISVYYRRTSIETKRLDSLMRSALYASYSETLTGLSTIRAYRSQENALRGADHGLDMENRAYYMTISIQRWLAIRLDFLGNILVFGIALFATVFRRSVNPAKTGVVLSYTLAVTQVFSDLVSMFAQNEQNMNAVERLLHYTELPCEGETTTPNDPPASWPDKGRISFTDVKLAYREGLPLVLKGITFDVKPGEKVGIVGRTGAGKSSLLQALFRTVELQSGKVEIDGYNIREIGLDVLRGRLALVPQDSSLFLGTLRENLDPQGLCTDAELISLLQRARLLPSNGPLDPVAEAKFSLNAKVGDEGSNYSAGEKQLLALCRALVKNSKIIVLDEATSSVDVETDAKLQKTIQTEFASATLLCIAHRLNTIAYYDRVMVMEAGKIEELDTVMNLFDDKHSIFRSLCDEANLQRADILRIREEHRDVNAVKA